MNSNGQIHNSRQTLCVLQGDGMIYCVLGGTCKLMSFACSDLGRYKGTFQLYSPLSPSHLRIMRLSLFCVMSGFPCWALSTLTRPLCPGNQMTWSLSTSWAGSPGSPVATGHAKSREPGHPNSLPMSTAGGLLF